MNILGKMKVGGMIAGVVLALMIIVVMAYGLGKNDDQNWQIKQSITGQVDIIDAPGWYVKMFATVWTYPRAIQKYFSQDTSEGGAKDESIRGTFNDGGNAYFSTQIRIQTPVTLELRRKAHRDFSGNEENMIQSVRAHLVNCIKNSAPLMSASEHQSARKAEFTQIVHAQVVNGLYEMKKVEKELKDRTDEKGQPITVYATEIVTDEKGQPIISQVSPLEEYGIRVLQFSITGTQYDPETLGQFKAKKQAYLNAEKSKAEREQEVQMRLMVEEKGLREKAEMEAVANVEKAKATIAGELKVAVAEQAALEAEQAKLKADTEAAQLVSVATLKLEAAKLDALAVIALADAEETRIQKAGAFTERERGIMEIKAKERALVAGEISKIQVPHVMFIGNSDGQGGSGTFENLLNMKLLTSLGMLDDSSTPIIPQMEKPTSAKK